MKNHPMLKKIAQFEKSPTFEKEKKPKKNEKSPNFKKAKRPKIERTN